MEKIYYEKTESDLKKNSDKKIKKTVVSELFYDLGYTIY